MRKNGKDQKPRAWLEGMDVLASIENRAWRLRRPADLETLWAAMGEGDFDDERLPYWTELWPASLGLAAWLCSRKREIEGRPCLDLGCGLGLTAMVGQAAGAKVLALDYERKAIACCRQNSLLNHVPGIAWVVMDWRFPALGQGAFERLWAGDIMYERRFMEPVLKFFERALAPGGKVWLAEPGRKIFGEFLALLPDRGWRAAKVFEQRLEAVRPQKELIGVRIWEMDRGAKES